jgi:diguanylate cyclase (GGDEF)-like protein/PAS domain S-box-containing protein
MSTPAPQDHRLQRSEEPASGQGRPVVIDGGGVPSADLAVGESDGPFRQVFERSPQAMFLMDRETLTYLDANPAALALYDYSRAEFVSQCAGDIGIDGPHGQLYRHRRDVWSGGTTRLTGRHRTKAGEAIDVELDITDAFYAGRAALLIVVTDVTAFVSLGHQLNRQALYDAVTDLPNRTLFTDRLAQALARRSRDGMYAAILMLDLCKFQRINGAFGHEAGDLALRRVAETLSLEVRSSDTVARFGGDEFAILLDGVHGFAQVQEVCARIERSLARGVTIDGVTLPLTASIGISLGTSGDLCRDLLRNADLALYGAKSTPEATSYVYQPEIHERVTGRLQLEVDLREALARGQLGVHFQPVLELVSQRVVGVEALARWSHPVHGLIPPVEFIRLAEETGLIDPLWRTVLNQACARVRTWQARIPGFSELSVAVNLSPWQLEDARCVDDVSDALRASGLRPADLILEVTESALMRDLDVAAAHLTRFREMGVRLSLDDFGTGHSSLSQLKDLPIDILKVDRSFVSAMCQDRIAADLLSLIVHLGDALGVDVVAEGVESVDQARALRRLGDMYVQGYLYSKPLDPGSTRRYLAGRPRRSPRAHRGVTAA